MEDAPITRPEFDMDDIIFKVVGKDPTKLHLPHLDLIKQQLSTIDHTPDHPVYPVMIREAITELDEQGGSTKEAISLFIMRKYDVLSVVHPAKLIEQLEKLVEKEEILFTSENRYMLPGDNSGFLVRLRMGKKRLGQRGRGRRSNKLRKVDRIDQTQKDRTAIIEAQTENQRLNGPPNFHIEGSAMEQMRVIEEQPPQVMKQFLEEEQQIQGCSRIFERFHENECDEPPGFNLEGFEKHNHVQEERVEVSEEQGLEITGELLSQTNEGRSEAIEEDRYGLHARVGDDQRLQEEIQAHRKESEVTAAKSQLQLQAVHVIEDQVEAECQIKATGELCNVEHPKYTEMKGQTQPQVQQGLHVIEDCSRLEKSHVEAISLHSETKRQEVEVTEEQKMLLERRNVVEVNEKKKGLLELHNVGEVIVQEGLTDQTPVEGIQGHVKAVLPTEGQCQLQFALDVAEDQSAAECQINETAELSGEEHAESGKMKCKPQSQVQENLHVEEHSQLQQNYIESIDLQNKIQGQEVELTKDQSRLQEQYDEVPSNTNNLIMLERFDKKSEQDGAMILTPSSPTCQKLDHVGQVLPSPSFMENLMGLSNWIKGTEQDLKQVINYLNTVQVSKHNGLYPMMREVQMKPRCKPRSSSHSIYLTTESMQHGQNQKIKLSNLKKTREVEITALEESSQTQKRQAKPCNPQEAPKFPLKSVAFSTDLLIIDPEQQKMEKQQEEQQAEHPRTSLEDLQTPTNLEHAEQRQQLDIPRLKTAVEKILSVMEEFTTSMDIPMDSEQVEHRMQIDCQISGTPYNLEPDLAPQGTPPGLEQLVEQSSHECLQQISLQREAMNPKPELEKEKQLEISIEERHVESKLTTDEQPYREQPQEITLCHTPGNHECKLAKEKQLEISVEERPLEVEMAAVEQQCQMKQEIQRQPLGHQSQRPSESESGTAATAHDQQLHKTKHAQELKQLMVLDESSQLMKQQEMGCGQGKKTLGEQQRMKLRPRGPKPSGSDPAHFTNANDLDQTLSTIKLERKWKLESPIHKRPQRKRAKVDELSQLDKQEVDCHGKQKQLKSQPALITSDKVQIMGNPAAFRPSAAKDLVQTPQQHHPQKQELQLRIQCSSCAEQTADKIVAELLPSQHYSGQKDQLPHQHRGRPPKQNSDMYGAEKEFPTLNGLNHCEKQPSQIRGHGRHSKANTSTQPTMREPESDQQNHDEKRGRGRPSKSILAACQFVDVTLPPKQQSKQQEQQQTGQHQSKTDSAKPTVTLLPSKHAHHQERKKKPHGGDQGGVTRANAAATAAIISL